MRRACAAPPEADRAPEGRCIAEGALAGPGNAGLVERGDLRVVSGRPAGNLQWGQTAQLLCAWG